MKNHNSSIENRLAAAVQFVTTVLNQLRATALRQSRLNWWFAGMSAAVIVLAYVTWNVLAPPGSQSLPDFTLYRAGPERKAAFFSYLQPIVAAKNGTVLADRIRLERIAGKLAQGQAPGRSDKSFVADLTTLYKVRVGSEETPIVDLVTELLRRVDVIPDSLVLVQAAKESGWGTSRFARTGNNLFGQWCFTPGCGVVPQNRPEGKTHEVRSFDDVGEAIESYLLNINTHPGYESVRSIRAGLRDREAPVTGSALADGLLLYSERRQAYVDELKDMIRTNRQYLSPQI